MRALGGGIVGAGTRGVITAHGPKASAIAAALPHDIVEAVIFDDTGVADALADAQCRRKRGEFFHAFPAFDNSAVKSHVAFAAGLNASVADREERFYTAQMYGRGFTLNGERRPDTWSHEYAALLAAAQDVLTLADVILVRSHFAFAELCKHSTFFHGRRSRRVLLENTVPAYERRIPELPSVVLWTGRRAVTDATPALIGLEEFIGDVAYVGSSPIPNVSGRFIARDDASLSDALAVAGCVVCVDPEDPADAVAFARRGVPVVTPISCAAYEFVDGVVSWDMADASSLSVSVNYALGSIPLDNRSDVVEPHPASPVLPAGEDLPLVSILTATYNRRESLRRMLTCLAAQTYPNIESIIVNDAGESVDDIVAEFPFARLINADANRGTFFRAARLGLAEARGAYIAMLPDDDWFYPDHVQLLMQAMLRTGARVAHSFALLRFLTVATDGSEQTVGFNPLPYSATVNPTAALLGTPVAISQCLLHRDILAASDVGWPHLEVAAEGGSDQEYFMRIVQRHQLVAVDRYTCEFRDHPGNAGRTYNWAEAMEYVYRELQPVPGRPITEALREQRLAAMRSTPLGQNVNQPAIRIV